MLRHSSHLLFALLWVVAMAESLRPGTGRRWLLGLGVLEGLAYLAGVLLARRRSGAGAMASRWRIVGTAWLALLLGIWAVLCALSVHWLWLAFPLYFLVFFLVAAPVRWLVVGVLASWSVASGLLRPGGVTAEQVVGSLLGALVAVISWLVLEQLRAMAREQARLAREVQAAQRRLVDAAAQSARDRERQRLARDLHDTLAQGLNSIVLLSRATAARHPDLGGELGIIEQTARDNLAHARALLRDMDTAAASPQSSSTDAPGTDLGVRLRAIVDAASAQQRASGSLLVLDLAEEGTPSPLDAGVQHALEMATRSLLANVAQHSRSGRCRVTLTWSGDRVSLDVVDDGVGLQPQAVPGYGLRALRQRIAEVGGSVDVDSAPGQGCAVAVVAPLRGAAPAVTALADEPPGTAARDDTARFDGPDAPRRTP